MLLTVEFIDTEKP